VSFETNGDAGLTETAMAHNYDRAVEDLGNITMLEHVNLQVPEQTAATLLYVTGSA
jgi:hypothetical protein